MKEAIINFTAMETDVSIGEGAIDALWERLEAPFVIADKAMRDTVPLKCHGRTALLPAGEKTKSINVLEQLVKWLADKGCRRDSVIVAVGGGTVGDIAGFAAAVYMRGIDWHVIPTTLLAMADSSVGGKTGVNVSGIKNVAGAFHQPRSIAIEPHYLKSLTESEYLSGVGEILKAAVIDGDILYDTALQYKDYIVNREPGIMADVIRMACGVKADIVSEDSRESGRRVILNAGHTIAHAIESDSGYSIPHGNAVAMGLVMETRAAVALQMAEQSAVNKVSSLIEAYGFDTNYAFRNDIAGIIGLDKKQRSEYLLIPFIQEIGNVIIHKVDREQFTEAVKFAN